MQIRGLADFVERLKGDSEKMWARYGRVVSNQKKSTTPLFKERHGDIFEIGESHGTEPANNWGRDQPNTGLSSGFRGKYVSRETAKALTA